MLLRGGITPNGFYLVEGTPPERARQRFCVKIFPDGGARGGPFRGSISPLSETRE